MRRFATDSALGALLLLLAGCNGHQVVSGRCLTDRVITASRQDTQATIDQILAHNAGYLCECQEMCPER